MVIDIPLQKTANQEFMVILGQQNCNIRLTQRRQRMYLTLWVDDVEIWAGLICRDRLPMAQSRTYAYKFFGNLVFVDTEGDQDPQWERLGDRWRLFYITPDENLPAWFQTMLIDLEYV